MDLVVTSDPQPIAGLVYEPLFCFEILLALREYTESGLLAARPLGAGGVWSNLYAAVRHDNYSAPHVRAFLATLREISFRTLNGIREIQAQD
ncbi:hypothetical protein [Marinobacter changyiensis]|uniref:hypothetical protein n=1 Tax=Marinobacter changyiensis TaxID=2604091 RepID=UPI001264A5D8|nr:hypothetical protein [Marinobacter changyiensis]